jgi:hypothetical protein
MMMTVSVDALLPERNYSIRVWMLAFVLQALLASAAQASDVCAVVEKVVSGGTDLASIRTGKMEKDERPDYVVGFPTVWKVRPSPVGSKAWAESQVMVDVPMWTSWEYVAVLREAGPAAADAPRNPTLKATFETVRAELGACLGGWERADQGANDRSVAASEFTRDGWKVVLMERFHLTDLQTKQRKRRFVELRIAAPRPPATLLTESFDGDARGWLTVDPTTGAVTRRGDVANEILKGVTITNQALKGVTVAVRDGGYVLDLTGTTGTSFISTIPIRIVPERGFTITATLTVRGQGGAGLAWGSSKTSRNILLLTSSGQASVGAMEPGGWKGGGWQPFAGYRKDRNVAVIKRVGDRVEVSMNGTSLGLAGTRWFGNELGFVVNAGSVLIVDDLTVTQP